MTPRFGPECNGFMGEGGLTIFLIGWNRPPWGGQVGYKRMSKIRPNTEFRPEFCFLCNRTEPTFQKFGFGLTETEIKKKNSVKAEF